MSSILSQVTSGASRAGLRVVIGGMEKLGKTTLATMAPQSLLIPLEVGFAGINTPKTPMIQTLDEFYKLMTELMDAASKGALPYKTLAFDSMTALERMIHDAVIGRDPLALRTGKKMITMDSAHGGYGKAFMMANDEFVGILGMFDYLAVTCGLNIVLTCHVFSGKVMDPTSGEYDTWDLLLHSPKNNRTYGKREILTQWADVLGFLYEPIFVTKADNMSRGTSQNKGRVLGVSRTPSYVAGNRLRMAGEIALPPPPDNSWNYLADAIYKASGVDVFTR